jgi:putative transcriptional regulator
MEAVVKNNIHTHRTTCGYTQEDLAESVGVTRQTIISIEKGNYTPSVSLALRFAKLFKVPVEALFSLHYEK